MGKKRTKMSEKDMSVPNFEWMIDRCERKINDTKKLLSLLQSSEFASSKMKQVKVAFPGENPPLGMVFSQLYSLLLRDGKLREIIRSESENGFEDDQIFPFFIFWCTVIVYSNYIKMQGEQKLEL